MKTKQLLTFSLSLAMLMPVALFAQDKQNNRKDRIETMHIAYLSDKLNLTSEEAEKFWPVYNQYKADQDELRKQRQQNVQDVKQAGGIDNMSDGDVQKLIANETDLETKELELRKKYVAKFQDVIPARKVAKFFIAEDEFKRYLLNQLRKRREQNGRGMDDDQGPQ
jgi:hypothetical protein